MKYSSMHNGMMMKHWRANKAWKLWASAMLFFLPCHRSVNEWTCYNFYYKDTCHASVRYVSWTFGNVTITPVCSLTSCKNPETQMFQTLSISMGPIFGFPMSNTPNEQNKPHLFQIGGVGSTSQLRGLAVDSDFPGWQSPFHNTTKRMAKSC